MKNNIFRVISRDTIQTTVKKEDFITRLQRFDLITNLFDNAGTVTSEYGREVGHGIHSTPELGVNRIDPGRLEPDADVRRCC